MISFVYKFERIIISLILVVLLSSCSLAGKLYNINNVNISEYADNIEEEIIRCLKVRDEISLKNLFCLKIKDTEYLDKEMNAVFEFIEQNGGIKIEDAEWDEPFEHGRNTINDKIKYIGAIRKKVYIGEKEYVIGCGIYERFDKHKEYEGINNLTISEVSKSNTVEIKSEQNEYLGMYLKFIDYSTGIYISIIPKRQYEHNEFILPKDLE